MKTNARYYAKIGLQAAERAAKKVIEQASRDNKPMPVWNGEKVEYCVPPLSNPTVKGTRGSD